MLKITDVSASLAESSDVAVEPTIERAEITSERTAELSFTVTWNGERRQELGFDNAVPFAFAKPSTDPPGLVLVHEKYSYERRDDETWVPEPDDVRSGYLVGTSATLEPGESTGSPTWEVWADPEHASRIEAGTYTFTDSIGLEASVNVEWSLTVEIDEQ